MLIATFLVVVFVAIIGTKAQLDIPPELKEYIDNLHEDCLKEVGLTEDDHKSYDIESNKDQSMMCYMKCLMMKSQWMSNDGTIQYQFILETAPAHVKDVLETALNKCLKIENGSNKCEKAYNFNYCLKQADPVHWFFI